ncbi:hypothetical protein VIBNIAM115_40023 [Vibrio nigripulchritudo AM115]|nr:hypothetical protein VIBNIAM115_40023 [Vibrio nigripulchritudo AM115]
MAHFGSPGRWSQLHCDGSDINVGGRLGCAGGSVALGVD